MQRGQKTLFKQINLARNFYGDKVLCSMMGYKSSYAIKQWIKRENIPSTKVPIIKDILKECMSVKARKKHIKKVRSSNANN